MEKSKRFWAVKRLLCSWLLIIWVLFVFCFPTCTAHELRANKDLSKDSGICKSVDIRNTLNTFEALRGCRVVEGFVQILLFDNVNKSLFENISFPELTEITDYLLLYRVSGLVSLGNMFPNLAVIRGQSLLFGYAFIIFEMSSLQEINLYSLTDITRGLIRIDKNPSLCYVNSIDWSLIAHEKGEHFIKNIKPENECSLCPGDDSAGSKPCPLARVIQGVNDKMQGRHLCWNRENCQKVCPLNCTRACDKDDVCCGDKCLGGCANGICNVCKNFTMGTGDSRRCMTQCPTHLYEYLGRRCVTKEECTNFTKSVEHRIQHEKPYKIYNKSCLLTCPTNYMDDYNKHECIHCQGKCKKKCLGTNIDNVAAAQQLRDCTHINGSLEIQVRGGRNLLSELEENLKMIEEIDGYIKIVRSFPLVSLNFLQNLRVIRGNVLESQKYVFIVLDNQNLQDIWDWTNRTLRIDRGRLFFHFNPKLCLDKIKDLQIKANLSNYDDNEVASSSNGDKIACDLHNLTVNVTIIKSNAVTLKWSAFRMPDPRKLLAYLIYTIESPYMNKTLYDNRDACGLDGWTVNDVQITEDNATMQTHLVTGLKPYTQYAFYVKTYTIATERTGAQSNINYFRTKPSKPSIPQRILVTSNSSDSLFIKWRPPANPNGNVTSYVVSGNATRDDKEIDSGRDYCKSSPVIKPHPETTQTTPKTKTNDTCACEDSSQKSSLNVQEEIERQSQITFEDELQNRVYIKKELSNTRRKRQLFDDPYKGRNNLTDKNATVKNMTSIGNESYESFSFTVNGTDLYVNKLQHYTYYHITIKACRERVADDNPDHICSDNLRKTERTEMKKNADNISSGINITSQNATSVGLTWEPPANPNGMILNYQIEYRRIDVESSMPSLQCITRKKWEEDGKIYVLNLIPGNYSVRVKATSQAGDGEFTAEVIFYMEEASRPSMIIVLCVLFFIIVLLVVLCFLRKKCGPNGNHKLITSVNPEYVSTSYVPDDWEVPRKKIELHKELGQGSFGMVYEGVAKDIKGKAQIRCAIKTVNEHATERERIEFLNEASVMKAFDTAHVVKLLGVVSQGQPTLVVMELMANGDLKSYLRSHRPDVDVYDPSLIRQPPTLKRILQMAIEIADGMAYLSAKKYVHRDLAARNCMVAEDLTVKIGDFGMTRDVYETDYYRKGTKGLLPVRWMAPESLKDGVFTSSSDIWSYGVILWEMATLASQPYQGLSNDQVLRYVIDGGIMERPENCPDKLYMLMRCCWKHKPTERPAFLELCTLLLEDACPVFSQVSFYHSAAGMEARSTRHSHSKSQDDPSTPLRIAQELDENFALNSSENESEPEGESDGGTHIEFSSYPVPKDSAATANGYLGTNTSNGTTA